MAINSNSLEELLKAIDIIATQRANENNAYDQTIICTIVDNSNVEQQGYYTVTNNNITFNAYCENTTYKVGNYVRVNIPNGDYSQQKYITGLYQYNEGSVVSYVAPLDTFLETSPLIDERVKDNTSLVKNDKGLAANTINSSEILLYSNSNTNISRNAIYDTIGLQADFKCLFDNFDMRGGSYGLQLDLKIKLKEEDIQTITHSFYLDSSNFFGNPYNLPVYSTQAQVYDISAIEGIIVGYNLKFYQKNNFTYYDELSNSIKEINNIFVPNIFVPNIFVSNIYLAFGSDLYKIPDNTLRLYSVDSLNYSNSNKTKTLSVQWCNKDADNRNIGFSDGVFQGSGNQYNYSEIEYLNKSADNNRRISQQSENVKNSISALDASAKFNESLPLLEKIKSYIEINIVPLLESFEKDLTGFKNGQDAIQYLLTKDYVNTLNNDIKSFKEKMSEGLKNGTVPENISRKIINDDLNSIINDLENINNIDLSNYTSYQGIYDAYKIKIDNILIDYKEQLAAVGLIDHIEDSIDDDPTDFIPMDYSQYANKYDIYWYQYDEEYAEADPFAEKGWRPIGREAADRYIGMPIENNEGYLPKLCPADRNKYTITLNANKTIKSEKYKVILIYDHLCYYSNILEFVNNDYVDETQDNTFKLDALYIEHKDNSLESYQPLYDETYLLINAADARIDRAIKLSCKKEYGGDVSLSEAQTYWYVPAADTMINCDVEFLQKELNDGQIYPGYTLLKGNNINEDSAENGEGTGSKYYREGYKCFYKQLSKRKIVENTDNKTEEEIQREQEALDAEFLKELEKELLFYYRIKDYNVPTDSNNTITCLTVLNDGTEIETALSLLFGSFGTCGTDFRLIIRPATSQRCVAIDAPLKLLVEAYDYNNKKINTSFNVSFSGGSVRLDENGQYEVSTHGIFKASTNVTGANGQNVKLSSYYAVPWGADPYYYIEGATSITYNSLGTNPVCYRGEYKLFNANHQDISGSWEVQGPEFEGASIEEKANYDRVIKSSWPQIVNNKLIPAVSFLSNYDYDNIRVVESNGNWIQPLIITQNRYSSPMLNAWDGNLKIDEDKNAILSAMMVAGRKEDDNSFSGVVMGDVGPIAGIDTSTSSPTQILNNDKTGLGLYGFHEGAQSFGFNVDGTAYIGKSGGGRISFDGNHGFIYSQKWLEGFPEGTNPFEYETIDEVDENGNQKSFTTVKMNESKDGLAIDLQKGHIDAFNFKLTSNNVKFDSHELKENEEHFYHMNVETSELVDGEGNVVLEYIDRPNTSSFSLSDAKTENEDGTVSSAHIYFIKDENGEYVPYSGTEYPPEIKIYENVEQITYEKIGENDYSSDSDTTYYVYTYDKGYVEYQGNKYPTESSLYVKTITTKDIRKQVLEDNFEAGTTYYLSPDINDESTYISDTYPVSPIIVEQVKKEHGFYHIRFKSDGTLELSISDLTLLADRGITIGDLVNNIDKEFIYIEDEVIGNPDSPKPGTVYDKITAEVSRIEDEVIGIPKDLEIGTVFDHITGQVKYIKDEVIGIPPTLKDASVYSYVNAQSYLTTAGVFNGLTDGGERQGIYPVETIIRKRIPKTKEIIDANGESVLVYEYDLKTGELLYELNEDGKSYKYDETTGIELYINASYIRTGILTSSNWKGTLYNETTGTWYKDPDRAQQDATDDVILGKASWADKWTLHPIEGTYWNLNEGKMWASKFELNAWTNKILQQDGSVDINAEAGGLYLNSHPGTDGYYFSIGRTTPIMEEDGKTIKVPPNWIQYKGDGSLAMQMNTFVLDAFDEISKEGIYFNSHPEKDLKPDQIGYYFNIGNANNFIKLDHKGNFTIQTNSDFTLNAWHPANDACEIPYAHGIYISADGVQKDAEGNIVANDGIYFRAGIADDLSTLTNASEVIEVSKDRVLIASKHFVLDAWNSSINESLNETIINEDGTETTKTYETGGIYLNSEPKWYDAKGNVVDSTTEGAIPDQYISIGNGKHFIQYDASHELRINAKNFALDAWDDVNNKGVIIDSAPSDDGHTGFWLSVGEKLNDNSGNFIQFDKNNKLVVQIGIPKNENGEIIGNEGHFILNAWHDGIANASDYTQYDHGIYLNSQPGEDGIYFRAGIGDPKANLKDQQELIEVGQNRVLIASKHFVLDAYDDTDGGIYLNSEPKWYKDGKVVDSSIEGAIPNQYLSIGSKKNFIQYNANHELRMSVNKLIIDAFTEGENWQDGMPNGSVGGIHLDSYPESEESKYYLIVGCPGNFIQLAKDGEMTFQTNKNFVVNAWNENKNEDGIIIGGLYLNSNPNDLDEGQTILSKENLYMQIGNGESYMQYGKDGALKIAGHIEATSGNIAGWQIQYVKNKIGRIYGMWPESDKNYYLSLWSAYPNGSTSDIYEEVSGLSDPNWRIMIGAKHSEEPAITINKVSVQGYSAPDGFGVTRDGKIAASYGKIAGWELNKTKIMSNEEEAKAKVILDKDNGLIATQGKIGGWTMNSGGFGRYFNNMDGTDDLSFIIAGLFNNFNNFISGNDKIKSLAVGGSDDRNDWGLIVGQTFGVSYEGMFASAGKIGGWSIDNTTLSSDLIALSSNGSITVNGAGAIIFDNDTDDEIIDGKISYSTNTGCITFSDGAFVFTDTLYCNDSIDVSGYVRLRGGRLTINSTEGKTVATIDENGAISCTSLSCSGDADIDRLRCSSIECTSIDTGGNGLTCGSISASGSITTSSIIKSTGAYIEGKRFDVGSAMGQSCTFTINGTQYVFTGGILTTGSTKTVSTGTSGYTGTITVDGKTISVVAGLIIAVTE